MPITQDRLIRLIDITTRTLEWSDVIKRQVTSTTTDLYAIANALANETDPERLNLGLNAIRNKLRLLEGIFLDYPLSPQDSITLGEERGHFNATSGRNVKARDSLRMYRAKRVDEAVANRYIPRPGPDIDMEVEEDLRRQWDSLPSVIPTTKNTPNLPEESNQTLRNTIIGDAEPSEGDNLDLNLPAFMTKKPPTEH